MSRQDRPATPTAHSSATHGHGATLSVQQPSSSAVQQSLTDRLPLAAPWQPTQPSKQKMFFQKMPSVSAPLRLASKTKTGPTGQRDHKKKRKKHSPAHHPNTNKLTTTEQKQSQEKVDKTAEKRRAATTAASSERRLRHDDYNICLIIIGNILVFVFCYMLCREHDGNCLRLVLFQHHSHFTVT